MMCGQSLGLLRCYLTRSEFGEFMIKKENCHDGQSGQQFAIRKDLVALMMVYNSQPSGQR